MPDVLIAVPSRGRPGEARRLAAACRDLCETDWRLVFGLDGDDPALRDYPQMRGPVSAMTGPRRSLAAWTNLIAERAAEYAAVISLGDDHVPLTPGWDWLLLAALDAQGGGFAYPDDLFQRENLATCCAVSSPVIGALGWMMLPALAHYYVDQVWMDLGRAAGCLAYVPTVTVEHRHHLRTGQRDATYDEAEPGMTTDQVAYEGWRAGRMAADVATVQAAL